MAELTGVLAVLLIFLSGPYRTLQKRLPRRWGPVLSVWAHGNVSLAASVAVFLHLVVVGELEIVPVERSVDPPLLTYVATGLFLASLGSGLFGLYVATAAEARQKWLRFHRKLTTVFYLALLPHVFTEGIIQWPVFLLLAAGWGIVAGRRQTRGLLSRVSWPFSPPKKEEQPDRRGAGREMRRSFVLPLAAALAAVGIVGGLFVTKDLGGEGEQDEGEVEIYGHVGEVGDQSFTLLTPEGPRWIKTSASTEFEDGGDLGLLQRQRLIVEVKRAPQADGTLLADEIEVEGQEYGDQD